MNPQLLTILFILTFAFESCKKSERQLLDEGLSYYEDKKYNEAIALFSKVINTNDNLQEPYYDRAFCYWKLKKSDSALFDFQKVLGLHHIGSFRIEYNKENPINLKEAEFQVEYNDALYQKAQIEYELNMLKESFSDFKTLANEDYEKSNCYLWLGTIMLRYNNNQEAYTYFKLGEKFATSQEDSTEVIRMLKQIDSSQATKR